MSFQRISGASSDAAAAAAAAQQLQALKQAAPTPSSSSSSSSSSRAGSRPPARTAAVQAVVTAASGGNAGAVSKASAAAAAARSATPARSQQQQQEQQEKAIRSLLTQAVQQQHEAESALGIGCAYKMDASALTEEEHAALRSHKAKPLNLSPVNAAKYLPLLQAPPSMRKTLCIDLDETLVSSAYKNSGAYHLHIPCKPAPSAPVTDVFVTFRPFVGEFLRAVEQLFEIVFYTASVQCYAQPLTQHMQEKFLRAAANTTTNTSNVQQCSLLWRDHCTNCGPPGGAKYVKDLSLLGRDLAQVAIIDNSPAAYLFQPRNAIPITSWFGTKADDRELMDLVPMLQQLAVAPTVYDILDVFRATRKSVYSSGSTSGIKK
jgi:Dullard-like phosphatase family protein